MKKRVQYFLALTTILMMTACQSQQQTSQVDEEKQVETQEPEVKKTEIKPSAFGCFANCCWRYGTGSQGQI